MTSYGFKVFTVQLRRENTRKPPVAFRSDKFDYPSHLIAAAEPFLDSLVRGTPISAAPADEEPDDDETTGTKRKKKPVMQLISINKRGRDHVVFGSIDYGRDANFEFAAPHDDDDERGKRISIEDAATGRLYRFLLIAPPTEQEVGILAVEAIGRACPSQMLVRWMRHWSQHRSVQKSTPESPQAWYKLLAWQAVDQKQAETYLNSTEVDEVLLTSETQSFARRPKGYDFKLVARSGFNPSAMRRTLISAIRAKQTEEEFTAALATELGVDLDAVGHLEEGWLVLKTADGPQTVSVTHLPDVFTYGIGTDRPSDEEFVSAVKSRLKSIAGAPTADLDYDGW